MHNFLFLKLMPIQAICENAFHKEPNVYNIVSKTLIYSFYKKFLNWL